MNFYTVVNQNNIMSLASDMVNKLIQSGFTVVSGSIDATQQQPSTKINTIASSTFFAVDDDIDIIGPAAVTADSSQLVFKTVNLKEIDLPGTYPSIDVTLECPQSMVPPGANKWRIKFFAKGPAKEIKYTPAIGATIPGTENVQAVKTYVESSLGAIGPSNGQGAVFYNSETNEAKRLVYSNIYGNAGAGGNAPPPLPAGFQRVKVATALEYGQQTYTYYDAASALNVWVGNELTLLQDGSTVYTMTNSATSAGTDELDTTTLKDALGHLAIGDINAKQFITVPPDYLGGKFTQINKYHDSKFFFSRQRLPAYDIFKNSIPVSYCLSVTNRGIAIAIWETKPRASSTINRVSWMVVQHSVLKETGEVRGTTTATADSKCPLFCVYSSQSNDSDVAAVKYKYFTVQEKDINVPSNKFELGAGDAEDLNSSLNIMNQVSFKEDGNYLATFICDLTSTRFFYPDDLDMVATVSADLVGELQDLEVNVYGEPQNRIYTSLPSNGPNGTGMRLLLLKSNPNESSE